MNKYWFLAFIVWSVVIAFLGYEGGTWRAGAAQDSVDKKQTVAVHDDALRGQKDSADYQAIHAAVEARLNSLIPKVEVPNAKSKTAVPTCHVPADVMRAIGKAVKSRSPG